MHKGEFVGAKAKDRQVKILILGESHHISADANSPDRTSGVEATYDTREVVKKRYLESYNSSSNDRDPAYRFFDKIASAFGIDPETSRTDFWNEVFLGNYINVLCGVGDNTAVNLMKVPSNREIYNDQLFRFIVSNDIDVIFCFSRRVYNRLPSLAKNKGEHEEILSDGICLYKKDGTPKPDYISHCVYLPSIPHRHTTQVLSKTLHVYGMLHPSGQYGFDPKNYAPTLSKLIDL